MSTTAPSTADFATFEERAKASPLMAPYLWALRCALDPRTHEERIAAAVEQHIGAYRHLPPRAITGPLTKRIAAKLEQTSLAKPPCESAVRKCVRKLLESKQRLSVQTVHRGDSLSHASVIAST